MAVVAGTAVLLTAVVVGAQALTSSDEPAEAATSTTPAPEPTTAAPEPTETAEPSAQPTEDPTETAASTLTGQPAVAWTVSGTSYGPAGTEVWLAAEHPLGVPNVSEVAVVTAYAEAGPVVVGLDRTTGDELWRHEPGPGEAGCSVLDDGSTVACWSGAEDGSYAVTTLDTATGEVGATTEIPGKPFFVFSDDVGIVVEWGTDGSIHLDAFDDDLTPVWSTVSQPGLVPATEFYGDITAGSGLLAVHVSGASAVVDRASGELLTTSGDSALLLLPGGLLRDISSVDGGATITDGVDGRVITDGAGGAWDLLGQVDGLPPVVGVGARAVDPATGESPWSLEGDPAGLTATVVGDLVVPFDRDATTPVVAVDASTGEQRWVSTAVNGDLALHDGILVVETEETVVGVDPADGAVLWTVEHTPATSPTSFERSAYQVIGGSLVTSTVAGDITGYTFTP